MLSVKTDIQIRFADVDILGHVNNVNLQHYFDLGKNTYFQQVLGLNHVIGEQGLITAATNTSYLGQTRLTDQIYVETSVEKIGDKSLTMLQRIIDHANGDVRAESRSVMVAFNFNTQESISVPDSWRTKILDGQ